MAVTLLQVEQHVLNLLNETFDTTALDLRAGAAGGATIVGITPLASSVASTAKTLINKAAAELAQSCVPVPDTGSISWAAAVTSKLIGSFTPGTANNVLWAIRNVAYNNVPLKWVTRDAIERTSAYQSNWPTANVGTATNVTGTTGNLVTPIVVTAASHGLTTGQSVTIASVGGNTAANGTWTATVLTGDTFSIPATGNGTYTSGGTCGPTPTNWYTDGQSISLYPVPAVTETVTASGYAIPAPAVSDTSTFPWLNDDLSLHLLAWYIADMIARKNMEDQSLAARSDDWREWRYLFDLARIDLWNKIPTSIRTFLYPTAPKIIAPAPPGMDQG